MCSHWLWMRNVYLFRINFARVSAEYEFPHTKTLFHFFSRDDILGIKYLWKNIFTTVQTLFRKNFAKVFRSIDVLP